MVKRLRAIGAAVASVGVFSAWLTGFLNLYLPSPQRVKVAIENVVRGAPATTERFRFVLCWLDGDADGSYGAAIEASFGDVGAVKLFRSAVKIPARGARDDRERTLRAGAIAALEDWAADLAIVGRVDVPTEAPDDQKVSLWFVPREGEGTLHYGNQRRYQLDDGILGIEDFHFDLREQLELFAWTAVAPAATDEVRGGVVESRLLPLVESVTGFLERDEHLTMSQRSNFEFTRGLALRFLAEREGDVRHLEAAATAFRNSLRIGAVESQRDGGSTEDGAGTCDRRCRVNHLAGTLGTVGSWNGETDVLREAIDLYHGLVALYSRAMEPVEWAHNQLGLAATYSELGQLTCNTNTLEGALDALDRARDMYEREGLTLDVARSLRNRGSTEWLLGLYSRSRDFSSSAMESFGQAAERYGAEQFPLYWADAEIERTNIQVLLGMGDNAQVEIEEGIRRLDDILGSTSREEAQEIWNRAAMARAMALGVLGEVTVFIYRVPGGKSACWGKGFGAPCR